MQEGMRERRLGAASAAAERVDCRRRARKRTVSHADLACGTPGGPETDQRTRMIRERLQRLLECFGRAVMIAGAQFREPGAVARVHDELGAIQLLRTERAL